MTISVFLTWPGPENDSAAITDAFTDSFTAGPLAGLRSANGLSFIETYRPAPGDQPGFDDVPRPPLLVELNLADLHVARDLIGSAPFQEALTLRIDGETGHRPGSADIRAATVDVFTPRHFDLPGHAEPPRRTAALSYVVRYYRPAPDEQAFVDFYVSHHPLLLARFPGIRNVLCYLPTELELPEGMASSGAFFGNEVVFDDLDALHRALESDVLQELLAEGKTFPPYGHCEHHAMLRERVHESQQ